MSYLGIDVGTSRTKAVAYDEAFHALAESSTSYERLCPAARLVRDRCGRAGPRRRRVIRECGRAVWRRSDPGNLVFGLWRRHHGPGCSSFVHCSNIISTTDGRAQPQADHWRERFGRERTYHITGTTTHRQPDAAQNPVAADTRGHPAANRSVRDRGGTGSGIPGRPSPNGSGHRLDHHAAGYHQTAWSEEILAAAQIPGGRLPGLIAPGEVDRYDPGRGRARLGLARGLHARGRRARPAGVCVGAGLLEPGQATDSLGTVECITTLFDHPVLRPDLLENNFSNLLHVHGGRVASLAYNFSCGDLYQWMRSTLFSGQPSFDAMFDRLPKHPSRVLVLPHFAGSGTPHLDARSKGFIVGLTLQTTAGGDPPRRGRLDELRDASESRRVAAERHPVRPPASLRQRRVVRCVAADQSRYPGLEVQRLNVLETGCLGAALLAARGADPQFPISASLTVSWRWKELFTPERVPREHDRAYRLYQQLYPRMREILHEL